VLPPLEDLAADAREHAKLVGDSLEEFRRRAGYGTTTAGDGGNRERDGGGGGGRRKLTYVDPLDYPEALGA
jgi:hypothetical protein